MPYPRPTLTQLREQAMQDITAAPIGVDGFLQFAVVRVLAWVQAALAYLHYGYIDWISLMAVPWTALNEFLTGWAALIGVYQLDAAFAAGPVQFTGTAGVPIGQGTALKRSDGTAYVSIGGAVWTGSTATVQARAITAGAAGNAIAGTTISLATPIAGINSVGTVSGAGITGGADQETPAAFKARAMAEFAAPPQGGDRNDFIEWASAVNGVTRAWVNPGGAGAGTVIVYTMFDVTEAAFGGFPQGVNGCATNDKRAAPAIGDQLAVANAVYKTQPVTALVYSCAPINTPVAFTIANLGPNNTAAMQAAIIAALQGMFLELANVGGTIDPADGSAWPAIDPSAWYAALGAIPGLSQFTVPSPAAPLVATGGQLFTLGAINFTS